MRVEIKQARIVVRNGGCSRQRAETISRLTFESVHQMMTGQPPSGGRRLEHVETAPLRLTLDAMSDQQVARAAAPAVLRAITSAARVKRGS